MTGSAPSASDTAAVLPEETRPRRANRARWMRLVVGLILCGLLIPILADSAFWEALAGVNLPLVGLALILSALSVVSKAWRWGVVLAGRGIQVSAGYLVRSYFASMFFNTFLPSGMGGDVVRAFESARHTGHGAESVAAVIVERGSGMLVVFAAGSLGAFLVNVPPGVAVLAHGLLWGSLAGIALLWANFTGAVLQRLIHHAPGRLRGLLEKIARVHSAFRAYRNARRLLVSVLAQSVVTLVLTLASVYSMLLAFGTPAASFGGFAAAFAIITAIDVVPISLNGLGVREGSYVFFLGLVGVASPTALGVALLVRLVVLIQAALGGGWFVLSAARWGG